VAGGPIIRTNCFSCVYEGLRQSSFQALSAQVPTRISDAGLAAVPAYKQWFDVVNLPSQPYPTGRCAATDLVGCVAAFNGAGQPARQSHCRSGTLFDSDQPGCRSLDPGGPARKPQCQLSSQFTHLQATSKALTASLTHTRTRFSTETRFGFRTSDLGRVDACSLKCTGLIRG
jgi:hypothetical protein